MGINCNKQQLTTNNTLTQGVGLGVPTVINGVSVKKY